jgi:hypothetical protein
MQSFFFIEGFEKGSAGRPGKYIQDYFKTAEAAFARFIELRDKGVEVTIEMKYFSDEI